MNLKKFGTVISILMLITALVCKIIYGAEAIQSISVIVMLLFLTMLVCEVFPVMLVCILTLGIMPVLGVTKDFNTALTGFSNQVVFFILASFGIAASLMKVPVSKRVLKFLLVKFGRNSKLLVLVFMICTAIMSSVISNVPTCALFSAITLELLNMLPEDEKRQTGKTFMIGIPIASMIGGIATPAGSSINLLAIGLLEKNSGKSITFIQWMSIGLPIVVIILPAAWFLLVKIFPPADIEKGKINKFIADLNIPSKVLPEEKRALLIFAVILGLWLSSSWIPSINIMVVSLIGCGVYCIPNIGVLTTKEFVDKVSWDAVFLVGTVLSLGGALVNNGVSGSLIKILPEMDFAHIFILMCVTAAAFVLLIFIPVAPSLVAFFTPVVIHIAVSAGINPALTVMLCAMCAGNAYLLPLDTVALLAYSHGYFKMFEMAKVTALLQLVFIGVASSLVYLIGNVVM